MIENRSFDPNKSLSQLERELWHGTDYTAAKAICTQGFNRSYAGSKNGECQT